MSKKEKNLDIFISKLLDSAKIKYSADGSGIKEINDALKTASKKRTGKVESEVLLIPHYAYTNPLVASGRTTKI